MPAGNFTIEVEVTARREGFEDEPLRMVLEVDVERRGSFASAVPAGLAQAVLMASQRLGTRSLVLDDIVVELRREGQLGGGES